MLKKHMAACLVATAFAAAPVMAQTPPAPSAGTDRPTATGSGSTSTGSPAMQPGATGSSTMGTGSSTMGTSTGSTGSSSMSSTGGSSSTMGTGSSSTQASSGGMQGQFMTQMQPQQMMASKLIGTTVVSANNESIGDVNDVIVDRNGQAMAVIIGVGGFLGIGEKDVAVPFKQLEFTTSQQMNQQTSSNSSGTASPATTGSTTSSGTAGTTASGSMAGQQNTASNTSTATTGNTGNSGSSAPANSVANQNADGGVPDRIMLRMTKADLQAAPTFQASNRNGAGNNSSTNAPTSSTGTTGTTAPRP